MKEIKFRVFNKVDKKFIYSDEFKEDVNISTLHSFFSYIYAMEIFYYYEELQQFTGLIDKNDNEIYEGDIIKSLESGHLIEIPSILPVERNLNYIAKTVRIIMNEGEILKSTDISKCPNDDWISNSDEYYEIIGNIYEGVKT